MRNVISFLKILLKKIKKDDLISLSNELTYKLMLAIFPFIVFLMTLLGFFNLDGDKFLFDISESVPPQIFNIFSVFVKEVISEQHVSIMSTSLLVTVFSASSGFNAIMRGVNKSYGQTDTRNFIVRRIISTGLVFVFGLIVATSMVIFILKDIILEALDYYLLFSDGMMKFSGIIGYFTSLSVMLFAISFIYKMASCKKVRFTSVIPGALITVLCFSISSVVFKAYIENFSKYSVVYGSIGGIFILLLWLNLVSFLLLMGSEVNALLDVQPSSRK